MQQSSSTVSSTSAPVVPASASPAAVAHALPDARRLEGWITFVLGNAHRLSFSLLEPGNSIAASIANEFAEADSPMYLSSLIALGFVLFMVTFVVLSIARLMLRQLNKREGN